MAVDTTLLVRINNPSKDASRALKRAYNSIERALDHTGIEYRAVLSDTSDVRQVVPIFLRPLPTITGQEQEEGK